MVAGKNILSQLLEIRALLWDGCANILIEDAVKKLDELITQVKDEITE
ncbi:MAG: hypothetical protein PHV11_08730 [Candidatus Bipolaricaulis sp.]|jgi:hypothetical protein|nr:hypothetical protein [Candidatus Bipolaricaulis sp.]